MPQLLDIRAERREVVLFLPRLREIIVALFRREGWVFRDPASIRHSTSLDNDRYPQDSVVVRLREPVEAIMVGKWITPPHSGQHIMQFGMESLMANMASPAPILPAPDATVPEIRVGEIDLPPLAIAVGSSHERELRSIDL